MAKRQKTAKDAIAALPEGDYWHDFIAQTIGMDVEYFENKVISETARANESSSTPVFDSEFRSGYLHKYPAGIYGSKAGWLKLIWEYGASTGCRIDLEIRHHKFKPVL